MCIILIGKVNRELHNAAKAQNPDGFSLFTQKQGLIKAPTAAQVSRALGEFGIWHYRIRSSGAVNESNIHPFEVCGGKYLLYHNGIIGAGTEELSDTACLAQLLYDSPPQTADMVLKSLSTGNRFVLVSAANPLKYRVYGSWQCEKGVLMSHKMYMGSYYSGKKITLAEKAGWESENTWRK